MDLARSDILLLINWYDNVGIEFEKVLYMVAKLKNENALRIFLQKADQNGTTWTLSEIFPSPLLLEHNPIDRKYGPRIVDEGGRTLEATCQEAISCITMLLKRGASIEAQDDTGRTSLSMAASWADRAAILALIELGVKINTADVYGRTPLHYAAECANLDVLTTLL